MGAGDGGRGDLGTSEDVELVRVFGVGGSGRDGEVVGYEEDVVLEPVDGVD